jgi:hypothetical protein
MESVSSTGTVSIYIYTDIIIPNLQIEQTSIEKRHMY